MHFFSPSLIAAPDPVKIDKNRVEQTETVAYAGFSKGGGGWNFENNEDQKKVFTQI